MEHTLTAPHNPVNAPKELYSPYVFAGSATLLSVLNW